MPYVTMVWFTHLLGTFPSALLAAVSVLASHLMESIFTHSKGHVTQYKQEQSGKIIPILCGKGEFHHPGG